MSTKNMFCRFKDLINEADVEQIFARRLIEYLGYQDKQIRPKVSLTQLTVGGMRGKEALYRPDFAMKIGDQVRWILEAKSPTESVKAHVWQPRGYCTLLNGQYPQQNPTESFVLTNGIKTVLYRWDVNDPILELDFNEIDKGNSKFQKLVLNLSPDRLAPASSPPTSADTFILKKEPLDEVNAAFAWCHQEIYRKDNISQAAAFTEFVKVVFLKLLSDRELRNKYPNVVAEEEIEVPADAVDFSLRWIEREERHTPNPLDRIQFREFINKMEREIRAGTRKRIFNPDEEINLTPETIKSVVERIEHIYLFGIDADLNGRLFETFLNATMRGKDLGQYFTPRSIVKLGTKLALLKVNALLPDGGRHTDVVLDACCGTGGFLIEALAQMWTKVNNNDSLSQTEQEQLRERIANRHIYGIDVGREPPLARIARLNMYLHGDGGSSIFQADALDKQIQLPKTDSPELIQEKTELRRLITQDGFADVVLTNPPFAKQYKRDSESQARILDEYDIAFKEGGDKRSSLKSSLMFIERYHDLLKVGGRMVTVIDDGILSGRNYKWFRNFMRDRFIIRAVISLPGDAFQRSRARVKTSLLILEKCDPHNTQAQPPVFMYGCQYVGVDDPARRRTLPIDRVIREKAKEEIETVASEFASFLNGHGAQEYIVSPDRIEDRLDVKSSLLRPGRKVDEWKNQGLSVSKLTDLVTLKEFPEDDIIDTEEEGDFVTYLGVTYEGFAVERDEKLASDTQYSELYVVHTDDIVISNIAASYGSVAVVPEELDGCVVTKEYTVLRAKEGVNPRVVWMLLRSPEARADMLLLSTGANRTRVRWENLKKLRLPRPEPEQAEEVASVLRQAEEAERRARDLRESAKKLLQEPLNLNNEEAEGILRAFKPPR